MDLLKVKKISEFSSSEKPQKFFFGLDVLEVLMKELKRLLKHLLKFLIMHVLLIAVLAGRKLLQGMQLKELETSFYFKCKP